MNEFIEKLIGRLSEEIKKINDEPWLDCEERIKKQCIYCNTIKIINELAEEYKSIMNYNTLLNDIKNQLKQFIADSNNIDYNRALVEAMEVIDKKAEEHNGGCCDWKKYENDIIFPYKTSCGNSDLYDDSYKFCPYCGKEIKVVE